ncbi:MAG: SIMPL domain-containing protein [Pirellulales bacterium]|nr:SIMPL domain-containing protein [Pirellulales bacterium]
MSSRALKLVFVVFLAIVVNPTFGEAQFGLDMLAYGSGMGNDAVKSVGTVKLKIKPTTLRMYLQLDGKGGTLKNALANLKGNHKTTVLELEKLKAERDSISLGAPTIAAQSQQEQMEMMIQSRIVMPTTVEMSVAKPKGPRVYQVTALLMAEWPLPSDKPDELLLFVDSLTAEIEKIALSGKKDSKELTPEQQELLEEMEGASTSYSNDSDGVKPGSPYFVYVGTVSEDQRTKAMREAFGKAKKNAEQLALAARVKLGSLVGLTGSSSGSSGLLNTYGSFGVDYEIRNYLQQITQGRQDEVESSENEVVGLTPGALSYQVVVTSVFKIAE